MAGQGPVAALISGGGAHAVAPRSTALALTCVADIAGFRALRDEWRVLHASAQGAAPFTTWEWLFSWWQIHHGDRPLRLLVVRAADVLVGVAPLFVDRAGPLGLTRVLRFVGDGTFDSDYLGIVAAADHEADVTQRVVEWLASSRDWHAVALRELPPESPLAASLGAAAARRGWRCRVEHGRSAILDLPASFDAFLRERQARFRTRLRALTRKLDEGALAFEPACPPRELRTRLRSLFDLHQRRWQQAGDAGVFAGRSKRRFYARFATRFARNGWLRLYSLRRGHEYVAHQLCLGVNGVTYLLQEGFDVRDPTESYGQVLRAAVVRDLIQRGEKRYDFLGGFTRHKADWGARESPITHVLIARPGPLGLAWFHQPALRERAAGTAKRVLPAKLVEWLRARRA